MLLRPSFLLSRLCSHHFNNSPLHFRPPTIRRLRSTIVSTDMAKVNTTERLASLRKLMKDRSIDMYSAWPSRVRYTAYG
jgi:hypothetical protein